MSTGLRSQLAPKGLHFSPSEFFISDKYATILTVVSYPKYISPGYLSSLTSMSGIKIVVKHIPVPAHRAFPRVPPIPTHGLWLGVIYTLSL